MQLYNKWNGGINMQIYKNGNRWSVDVFDTEGYKELIKNVTIKDYGKRIGRLFNIEEDYNYVISHNPYEKRGEGNTVIYKREDLNNPGKVARLTHKLVGNESR